MKITIIQTTMIMALTATLFTGCGGGSGSSSENDTFTSGTILYNDGSTFGVTREEAQVNGGFQIYDVGTGSHIGNIQVDSLVSDVNGNDLGVCTGTTITDKGVSGECSVPTANPNSVVISTDTVTKTTTSSSKDSGTSTSSVTISANITFEGPIYNRDNVPFTPNVSTNSSSTVTYKWTVTSRPAGSSTQFSSYQSTASIPNLNVDIVGNYTVKVVVTVDGKSATDTVSFTAIKL